MKEILLNGKPIKIASTIDAIGFFCPIPIVMLKKGLEKAEPNQVIEILADDPAVMEDIPAWCHETGNKLLSLKNNGEGIFIAYVLKERK